MWAICPLLLLLCVSSVVPSHGFLGTPLRPGLYRAQAQREKFVKIRRRLQIYEEKVDNEQHFPWTIDTGVDGDEENLQSSKNGGGWISKFVS